MAIIYHLTIQSTSKKNIFSIQWTDPKNNSKCVNQPNTEITSEEMDWMWKDRRNQLKIGKKLFRFLDGDKSHLEHALKEAEDHDEILQLHLYLCHEIANWPFELLAQGNTFLLPHSLHLVRRIQSQSSANKLPPFPPLPPQNRRLRLLFMACSPLDIQAELDFEKEEDAIFKAAENLALDMDIEETGTLDGLKEKLAQMSYDIVHISGHAGIDKQKHPFFLMENEFGYQEEISVDQLWQEGLKINPPRLLFISGGSTGDAPEGTESAFAQLLLEKYNLPTVLGWGRWISDSEANEAAKVIYTELSRGQSILQAVQRARYQGIQLVSPSPKPAWPQLRLFSSNGILDALVTAEQKRQPQARRMTHIYLRNSEVKVLGEGFVGRRRQLQRSYRALMQKQVKVGLLIMGTGGLGKSCLAGKVSERFTDYTPIIVHGRLNSLSLKKALKDAFIISGDEYGKEVLSEDIEMKNLLGFLCQTSFKEKKYIILLDDFEQNLVFPEKGKPGNLLPESSALLEILLDLLPQTLKSTQLLITCRYRFFLLQESCDIVKKHLDFIWLTSFRNIEQKKKLSTLPNISNLEDPGYKIELLSTGCGNPRLMEWIDILVGEIAKKDKNGISELLVLISGKKKEFIQKHVIDKLLIIGGKELSLFLQWFAIYRRPVSIDGARAVGEKAGLKTWKNVLNRGMELSLVEHDQAHGSYQTTPLLRDELLIKQDNLHSRHEAAFAYYKSLCQDKPEEQFDPVLTEELVYHALECGEEEVATIEGSKLVNYMNESMAFLESLQVGTSILAKKKEQTLTKYDASLLNSLAYSLEDLGEPHKAVKLYEKALIIDESIFGKVHPNVAIRLNNIGSVWHALGEQKKAISYFNQALNIWKNLPGEIYQEIVFTLNNLGIAWQALTDYPKATGYFQEALKIDEELHGRNHPDVATRLNNLGGVYRELGDLKKALQYYQEALEIDKLFFGQEHHRIALRLNNLGETWRLVGEPEKAYIYYQEALTINLAIFGKDHPMTAISQANLGSTSIELNRYYDAVSALEQALEIFKNVYGDNHKNTSSTLSNLGLALKEHGNLKKAVGYLEEAYKIDKKLFGMKHPDVTTDLNNLASIYIDMGNYDKALKYCNRALSIDKELFGEDHLNIAFSLNILGLIRDQSGQHQEAIVNFQEALSIWQKLKEGEKHPLIAELMGNLGSAWANLGDHQKALNLYRKALDIGKSIYGSRHSNIAIYLNNIGSSLQDIGDIANAIDYYRKALSIDTEVFGEKHPNTGRDFNNLGTAYFQLGKIQAAREFFEHAYTIFNNSLGPEHPNTKKTAKLIEKLKQKK